MSKSGEKSVQLPEEVGRAIDAMVGPGAQRGEIRTIVVAGLLALGRCNKHLQYALKSWARAVLAGEASMRREPPWFTMEAWLPEKVHVGHRIKSGVFADDSIGEAEFEVQFFGEEDLGELDEDYQRELVPILSKTSAGLPMGGGDMDYPPGAADEYVNFLTNDPNAFALKLVGDSMEPHFHEGDVVVFGPRREARDGMLGVMVFAGGTVSTFKRIRFLGGGRYELLALNERYPKEMFTLKELDRIVPAIGLVRERS